LNASQNAPSSMSREAMFAACDHSRDLFVLLEDGRIIRSNAAWKNFVGLDEAELRGRLFESFVNPEDRPDLGDLHAEGGRKATVRITPRAGVELAGRLKCQPLDETSALLVITDLAETFDPVGAEAARRTMAALRDSSLISLWRFSPSTFRPGEPAGSILPWPSARPDTHLRRGVLPPGPAGGYDAAVLRMPELFRPALEVSGETCCSCSRGSRRCRSFARCRDR